MLGAAPQSRHRSLALPIVEKKKREERRWLVTCLEKKNDEKDEKPLQVAAIDHHRNTDHM